MDLSLDWQEVKDDMEFSPQEEHRLYLPSGIFSVDLTITRITMFLIVRSGQFLMEWIGGLVL